VFTAPPMCALAEAGMEKPGAIVMRLEPAAPARRLRANARDHRLAVSCPRLDGACNDNG
jgi:hypothetical protein